MTRRRMAVLGTGLALVGALFVAVPASPAGAATPQCTKQVATSGVLVPAASNGSRSCWMDQSSNSSGVRALQRALVYCYGQKIAIDGDFGPATANALARAQKVARAKPDGMYGPETAGKLKFSSTKTTSKSACHGQFVKAVGP